MNSLPGYVNSHMGMGICKILYVNVDVQNVYHFKFEILGVIKDEVAVNPGKVRQFS